MDGYVKDSQSDMRQKKAYYLCLTIDHSILQYTSASEYQKFEKKIKLILFGLLVS